MDLQDQVGLEPVIRQIAPEWVFHLAVHGAYSWQTDLYQITATNFLGTVNLVEACLKTGFEALVNTGSSSEYGLKDHAPAEDEWLEPNSAYAVSKAAATQFCRFTAQQHRVHLPTLRLYSVYGPYEDAHRLIPSMIKKGLEGILPPLADPEIARDYVYVEDVIDAYLLAAAVPGQEPGVVYNVGSGIQTTLRQVVECAQRVLAIHQEPVWGSMPNRQWDTRCWVANPNKIKRSLGWAPRFTFEAGFCATLDWFRSN
jgi:nucleoside-diphosphate-sugar epimerase